MGEPLSQPPPFPPPLVLRAAGAPPPGGILGAVSGALGLSGAGNERTTPGLRLTGDTLRAETVADLARVLRGCASLNLRFRVVDDGARWEVSEDLDALARPGGPTEARLTSDFEGLEVIIDVRDEGHVRQSMWLGGACLEVLDATPGGMVRTRRPVPEIGSPELRLLLRAQGLPLPPASPPDGAPEPLRGPLAEIARAGRVLVWKPNGSAFAYGLFRPADMIRPMRGCLVRDAVPAEGAPPIVAGSWPFYTWGPLHLAHVGWAPDFTSYYLDQEGCVWSFDPTQDQIELWAGSVLSFVERFARGPDEGGDRESGILFFPMAAPGELPSAFGASPVPRRSAPRSAMWVSDTLTIWESTPPLGAPLVEVQGRTDADLPAVLRWARRRWGIRRAAYFWMPAHPDLERAAGEEGIELVDGGPSTWKPASFWE